MLHKIMVKVQEEKILCQTAFDIANNPFESLRYGFLSDFEEKDISNQLKVKLSTTLKYNIRKNFKKELTASSNYTYLTIISKNLQKYNSTPEINNVMAINNLIKCKSCHFLAKFKDYLIIDFVEEFIRKVYSKKESFEIYDTKKDGSISLSDYENVLKLLKLSTYEFQDIIQDHNLKGMESIKFEEFITDINSMKDEKQLIMEEQEEDKEKLINAFKCFEEDQEGKISIDNFKEILKSDENGATTEEEIEFLISQFGKDGYIDYNEFINVLLNK